MEFFGIVLFSSLSLLSSLSVTVQNVTFSLYTYSLSLAFSCFSSITSVRIDRISCSFDTSSADYPGFLYAHNPSSMKQRTFLTILLLLSCSDGFVIRPNNLKHVQVATSKTTTTELELSSQSIDSSNMYEPEPQKENTGILKKIANFFTPWWLKHKDKDVEDKEEVDVILSPRQRSESKLATRQLQDALQPFSWPFRATGEAITKSISRELSREQQKAKPLLKDAQRLLQKDKDLVALLGTPVHLQPIFSGSSSTSTVNWKKTKRIVDRFVVEGSKKKGVATLTADEYKKGHILALRVDVSGIHYDVET